MSKADVASERKEQIVKATVDCISKYGYHNFSMQDVARTAGVSKGIIHYYFLNKDELMRFVLEKVSLGLEGQFLKNINKALSPVDKIKVFIELAFEVVQKTREYYQVSMDFWTQINQKEDVRQIISKHYDVLRGYGQDVIKEGIESGDFKKVDPYEYASYIMGVIDGISLQWLFDHENYNYEAMVRMASSELIRGLQK